MLVEVHSSNLLDVLLNMDSVHVSVCVCVGGGGGGGGEKIFTFHARLLLDL